MCKLQFKICHTSNIPEGCFRHFSTFPPNEQMRESLIQYFYGDTNYLKDGISGSVALGSGSFGGSGFSSLGGTAVSVTFCCSGSTLATSRSEGVGGGWGGEVVDSGSGVEGSGFTSGLSSAAGIGSGFSTGVSVSGVRQVWSLYSRIIFEKVFFTNTQSRFALDVLIAFGG